MIRTPIIITLPGFYDNETDAVCALADAGADIIHFRKPDAGEENLNLWLGAIPENYRDNLTIHYRIDLAEKYMLGGIHSKITDLKTFENPDLRKSTSCHSWEEVENAEGIADYVFLSPVFDSVLKEGYKSAFDHGFLKEKLNGINIRTKVVALGGIASDNIGTIKDIGFDGVAMIGSIWSVKENKIDIEKTTANYIKIMEEWQKKL